MIFKINQKPLLIFNIILSVLFVSCDKDDDGPYIRQKGSSISPMDVNEQLSNVLIQSEGVLIDGLLWSESNCGNNSIGVSQQSYQWGRTDNTFLSAVTDPFDWCMPQNDDLWKSESPCPKGWRLPTQDELVSVSVNYSEWTTHEGQQGRWFSGSVPYSEGVKAIFLPAHGVRGYSDGGLSGNGAEGWYWSGTSDDTYAVALYFHDVTVRVGSYFRSRAMSVRCCKDIDIDFII